jgi:hypothetical protein
MPVFDTLKEQRIGFMRCFRVNFRSRRSRFLLDGKAVNTLFDPNTYFRDLLILYPGLISFNLINRDTLEIPPLSNLQRDCVLNSLQDGHTFVLYDYTFEA